MNKEFKDEYSQFKDISADFIKGRINAIAFDKWFLETLDAIREKVIQETIKEIKTNIGLLRQWLNEDRITDLKKIVSNEDLERWLLKNLINLPKE